MTVHRLILVSLISIIMTAVPSLQADTVGTAFTYQGVLSDAGAPVEGDYDFRVFLYNADVGGGQVGTTVLVGNVAVTDGRVALDVDFGDVFDGTALWLEIHLRETGTTTYTPLWPRQRLTATPFATHAAEADTAASALWADDSGSALTAADADQLGGQSPAYYLAWSNITGVPADLSNGDDDTLADLSCAAGEIAKWNGSAWDCGDDAGGLSSTYIVGPVGTATENGTALRTAVGTLPTATESAQVLVHLEPGTYDLGTNSLALPDWVSLEGAGRTLAIISSAVDGDYATVNMGMDSGLRSVTVLNSSAGTFSYAVTVNDRSRVFDVTAISEGNASRSRGVNSVGDDVVIENADLEVLAGTGDHSSYAIWGFDLTLRHVDAVVNGAAGLSGAITSAGTGTFIAENVTASATNTSTAVFGIWVVNPDARLTNIVVEAHSTTSSANGIYTPSVEGRGITMVNVDVAATGAPSFTSCGVNLNGLQEPSVFKHISAAGTSGGVCVAGGDGPLTIQNSQLSGGDWGLRIASNSNCTVDVHHSTLDGTNNHGCSTSGPNTVTLAASQIVNGTFGPTTCAGVWDENHTFYPSTCP